MSKTEAIHLYSPLLHSIALRIVGSIHDAEDIVQDTFEKWLTVDTTKIQNTKAYLIRSVSNNCFKYLKSSRKTKGEVSVFNEEVVEIPDLHESNSLFHFDLEAQMDHAWLILHKKLEPVEKYIFVLREAFNLEYEEMQHLFDKKVDNLRQIVSRARQKLKDEKVKLHIEFPKSPIPKSFLSACTYGHISEVVSDFRNEMLNKISSKKN